MFFDISLSNIFGGVSPQARETKAKTNKWEDISLKSFCLTKEMKWKSLSHVWLFVTLWTIQSMEFSRPEYWSRYPFPSPGSLPNPGIKPRSPTLQADSLSAEPQEKPKNIRAGGLSLLQGIFLTQESSWGLLHCRWILYQLSSQESKL